MTTLSSTVRDALFKGIDRAASNHRDRMQINIPIVWVAIVSSILFVCDTQNSNTAKKLELKTDSVLPSNVHKKAANADPILEDTMVHPGRTTLNQTPDSQESDEDKPIFENCTLVVLEREMYRNRTTVSNEKMHWFVKVKTLAGDSGFVRFYFLTTKKRYKEHNDSIAMWDTLPLPDYSRLIGFSYNSNNQLPPELASGSFVSVGKDNLYGIISVGVRYSKKYSMLFFTEQKADERDRSLIHDILYFDWTKIPQDASLWFQRCQCTDTTDDCSDVVGLYFHSDSMAMKELLVTPLKAWRPNYKKKKLEEIDPNSVRCGSTPAYEEGP